MTTTIDSIDITGLRKTHLAQLSSYIRMKDGYYGNKKQFDDRHADLLKLAEQLDKIYNDENIKIAREK